MEASVVKIVDDYRVVINKGSNDGVKIGDKYLIYSLSDEDIIDPQTDENLGKLEIVKGRGLVSHVQNKMATIESSKKISVKKSMPGSFNSVRNPVEESSEYKKIPFEDADVGDFARFIGKSLGAVMANILGDP